MNKLTTVKEFTLKESNGVVEFSIPIESLDFNSLTERQLDIIGHNYNMTKIDRLSQQNFLSKTENGKLKQKVSILEDSIVTLKRESDSKISQTRAISKNVSDKQSKEITELKRMLTGYISEACIDGNEQDKIVESVSDRVNKLLENESWMKYLKKNPSDTKSQAVRSVAKRCYSAIHSKYSITSYRNLKKKDIEDVIEFISKWEPTKF